MLRRDFLRNAISCLPIIGMLNLKQSKTLEEKWSEKTKFLGDPLHMDININSFTGKKYIHSYFPIPTSNRFNCKVSMTENGYQAKHYYRDNQYIGIVSKDRLWVVVS